MVAFSLRRVGNDGSLEISERRLLMNDFVASQDILFWLLVVIEFINGIKTVIKDDWRKDRWWWSEKCKRCFDRGVLMHYTCHRVPVPSRHIIFGGTAAQETLDISGELPTIIMHQLT